MAIVPPSRPMQSRAQSDAMLRAAGIDAPVALLGVRAYYRDTLGRPGVNDRGIYDDALFVVSTSAYVAFNANTDPSYARRGIAVLERGTWLYKPGKHRPPNGTPYDALRQAAPVTVWRDEVGDDTGMFGINIHRGGWRTTSSLGCQTIFPAQWEAFLQLVYSELRRAQQPTIPYALVERE